MFSVNQLGLVVLVVHSLRILLGGGVGRRCSTASTVEVTDVQIRSLYQFTSGGIHSTDPPAAKNTRADTETESAGGFCQITPLSRPCWIRSLRRCCPAASSCSSVWRQPVPLKLFTRYRLVLRFCCDLHRVGFLEPAQGRWCFASPHR